MLQRRKTMMTSLGLRTSEESSLLGKDTLSSLDEYKFRRIADSMEPKNCVSLIIKRPSLLYEALYTNQEQIRQALSNIGMTEQGTGVMRKKPSFEFSCQLVKMSDAACQVCGLIQEIMIGGLSQQRAVSIGARQRHATNQIYQAIGGGCFFRCFFSVCLFLSCSFKAWIDASDATPLIL